MSKIIIRRLTDTYDCETCGGSWAEGAEVYQDEKVILELTPVAHCHSGTTYSDEDLIVELLKVLGHEVEFKQD